MNRAKDDGELTLEVDGQKISGWTEIRVTRSIERIVSDFEIALTERFPGGRRVLVKPGQACRVLLGDDLVITGYVDRYIPEISGHEHTVRISGRGKLQDAVDCSATWPNGQVMNGTLRSIAEQLLKPFGIDVLVETDTGPALPKQVLNIGDSVFDVLEPIARYRAVLMYEDPSGGLVLSKVGSHQAAFGLSEGENIEAAGVAYSMDQRFSDYSAYRVKLSAFKDAGLEANLIVSIGDPGVPRYRPKAFVAETFDGGLDVAERRAVWEALRRAGRSAAVHLVTDSWRDRQDVLWAPNTLVQLKLPTLNLPDVTWLIGEVTYTRNAGGGTHARLVIMQPEAFAPQPVSLQKIANNLAQALQTAAAKADAEKDAQ